MCGRAAAVGTRGEVPLPVLNTPFNSAQIALMFCVCVGYPVAAWRKYYYTDKLFSLTHSGVGHYWWLHTSMLCQITIFLRSYLYCKFLDAYLHFWLVLFHENISLWRKILYYAQFYAAYVTFLSVMIAILKRWICFCHIYESHKLHFVNACVRTFLYYNLYKNIFSFEVKFS